jgi:replication factor C large subunit
VSPAAERSTPLADRRRPHRLADLVGGERIRAELGRWADQWQADRPPARRAAVLSGPPGVGKTTAALALAEERGWTLVEMNASDARNETAVEQVAGRASLTRTLGDLPGRSRRTRTLILLDEADCLTGRLDDTPRAAPPPPTLREFLRGRYGSIEALNAAWELGTPGRPAAFEGWDDLPRSPGRAAWTRLAPAQRDLADLKGAARPRDLTDRGGLGAIARIVKGTLQPIVLTVNDERALTRYSPVFRTSVLRLRLSPLAPTEMTRYISGVAHEEGIPAGPEVISAIVQRARGDLRGALNDLDAIAPLPAGPAQLSVLGVRDLRGELEELTEEALTARRFFRSVEVQDRLDAPPDDLFPWVEENVAHFAPDASHRASALDVVTVADRFLFRARRARVWSQWSYASELLTGGVGFAIRDAAGPVRQGAAFPAFLGEMGRSRASRAFRDSLAAKLGRRLHLSKAKARSFVLPVAEGIVGLAAARGASERARRVARALARELELTDEELAFLLGAPADAAIVRELLAGGEETPEPPSRPQASPPESSTSEPPAPSTPATPRRRQRSLGEFGGT